MKISSFTTLAILAMFLVPASALAAYDDVTLTTDAVISVNGIPLNVSGSSAVIQSLTVNETNFSFTLQSGSSIQITAPNGNALTASTVLDKVTDTCTSAQSILKYVGTTDRTVTITPNTIMCSGSGTGGGHSGYVSSSATRPSTATSVPVTVAPPAVANNTSALTSSQVQSILSLLSSFGADNATIARVQAALGGAHIADDEIGGLGFVFVRDLQLGSTGADVLALQKYLNTHQAVIAATGDGSPGKETSRFGNLTKAALIKYQKAHAITPAVGYFGPKTRAVVNAGR